jgi:hypothetical protein
MLMFQPPKTSKLFCEQFPVVWSKSYAHFVDMNLTIYTEVITFRAKGRAKASVHYVARLAFGYAQTVCPQNNSIFCYLFLNRIKIISLTQVHGSKSRCRILVIFPLVTAHWLSWQSSDISSISGGPGQKRVGDTSEGSGTKLLVCKNNTDSCANLSIGTCELDYLLVLC